MNGWGSVVVISLCVLITIHFCTWITTYIQLHVVTYNVHVCTLYVCELFSSSVLAALHSWSVDVPCGAVSALWARDSLVCWEDSSTVLSQMNQGMVFTAIHDWQVQWAHLVIPMGWFFYCAMHVLCTCSTLILHTHWLFAKNALHSPYMYMYM